MQIWVFFLCSLDNLLQKNVINYLEIKFQNDAHLKKEDFFDLLFTFLVTREKLHKFLQHISHSHTHTYFAHIIDFFAFKNTNLSGMIPVVFFLFAPFWYNQ